MNIWVNEKQNSRIFCCIIFLCSKYCIHGRGLHWSECVCSDQNYAYINHKIFLRLTASVNTILWIISLSSVVHFIVCSVGPGVGKLWPVSHMQLVDAFQPVQGGFMNLTADDRWTAFYVAELIIMNCFDTYFCTLLVVFILLYTVALLV